jgi:limonene-1,2-epoxide hydrolase
VGAAQEATVRELLSLFDAGDFRPNLDRAMSLFVPDATYQMSVPGREPLKGRDEIVGELTRQAGDYKDCECEVLNILSNDRFVVTERIDHVTMLHDGKRVSNPLLAIFELDENSRIVNWREYWDALSLSQRMGVDAGHMMELMGLPR